MVSLGHNVLMFSLHTSLSPQVCPVLLSSPPKWQRCSLLRSWDLPITWSGLRFVPATWTAGSPRDNQKCISEKTDRIWEAGPSFKCQDRLIGCWSFYNKQIRLLWDRLIFIMWISSLKQFHGYCFYVQTLFSGTGLTILTDGGATDLFL